MQSLKIL